MRRRVFRLFWFVFYVMICGGVWSRIHYVQLIMSDCNEDSDVMKRYSNRIFIIARDCVDPEPLCLKIRRHDEHREKIMSKDLPYDTRHRHRHDDVCRRFRSQGVNAWRVDALDAFIQCRADGVLVLLINQFMGAKLRWKRLLHSLQTDYAA